MTALTAARREALKKTSAAMLTTVLVKRGLRNVFIQSVFLSNQKAPRMGGDGGGLVEIPAAIASEVPAEALAQTEFEDRVEARVNEGRPILGLYPPDAQTGAESEHRRKTRT